MGKKKAKRFEIRMDRKMTYFIWDNQTRRVVKGNIPRWTAAKPWFDWYKAKIVGSGLKIHPNHLRGNHERVMIGRARRMKISMEQYRQRFCAA
jgi:hypothetical protein